MLIGYGGKGQFWTDNDNAMCKSRDLYEVDWLNIINGIENPESLDKNSAKWVIFNSAKSRLKENLNDDTLFFAMWLDIDKGNISFERVKEVVNEMTRNSQFLIYTTKSCIKDNMKTRVIIPFKHGISFTTYKLLCKIKKEFLNKNGIIVDDACFRPMQLCYLPNKGEYYKWERCNVE